MQITKLFFILQVLCVSFCQTTCSAYCDIYFDGTGDVLGCTDEGSTSCTHCFPQLYYLSGSTCLKRTDIIYNSTTSVSLSSWSQSNIADISFATFTTTFVSKTYYRFSSSSVAGVTYTIPSTNAHYGIRFRFWVYYSTASNQMYFLVNSSTNLYNLNSNFTSDATTLNTWIHNTDFINFTQSSVVLTFKRTDGLGSFFPCGVDDLTIFIAECVPNCISCSSLTDCTACTGLTYLNNQTNLCESSCPIGMYEGTDYCEYCFQRCADCNLMSTNCQKCVDLGQYQSFLFGSSCYENCPNGYIQNYNDHTCECPDGYYLSGGICSSCHEFCETCYGASSSECYTCNMGYYVSISANSTCSTFCPVGEYYRPGVGLRECFLCDVGCNSCQNSSTICTSCSSTYLYNYTCLSECPDGYEKNNGTYVCDICLPDTFSFQQQCISQCPQYYTNSDELRSCILSSTNGYPITTQIVISSFQELKFEMELVLGISSTNITNLSSGWQNIVKLYTIVEEAQQEIITNTTRLLTTTQQLTISTFTINNNNNKLSLTSSSLNASAITPLHSFKIQFSDNVYSSGGVMYTISSTYSFYDNPSKLQQYYDLNMPLLNLIMLPFIVIPLICLLAKIKYSFFGWLQYLQCLQLLGLTLYNMYPYSTSLDLYSFLIGMDYSNFSYIYNVPLQFIQACSSCTSFTGFVFIQGDMDFLRSIGSIIQLLAFCLFVIVILVNIDVDCSKKYGIFLMKLIASLIVVKSLHAWLASLIYLGLNMNSTTTIIDYQLIGTYFISFFTFVFVVYDQYKWKKQYGWINSKLIGIIIYVILIILIPFAPTLICNLIITITFMEWFLIHFYNINDNGVPQHKLKKQKQKQISQFFVYTSSTFLSKEPSQQKNPCQNVFHFELLLSIKPVTSLLIATITMLQNKINTIIIVCSIMGFYLILLAVDSVLLYQYHRKKQQKVKNIEQKIQEKVEPVVINIDNSGEKQQSDDDDEDIVDKRFWKKKSKKKGDSIGFKVQDILDN